MTKRNIYVADSWGSSSYANWMQGQIVTNIKDADLVVFTGGEDVNPALYGKQAHPSTSFNANRDRREMAEYKTALELNKPMIGICRGAQLFCALNGGILIQHQDNPSYLHNIYTYDGEKLPMTSMHHQAAYPFYLPRENYKILGWTNDLSSFHYGQNYQEELYPPKECEIILFPKTQCLGIQGHPEMIRSNNSKTINYLQNLLNKFLAKEI